MNTIKMIAMPIESKRVLYYKQWVVTEYYNWILCVTQTSFDFYTPGYFELNNINSLLSCLLKQN